MEASTTKVCAMCGHPATVACNQCSEGLDNNGILSPTSYCGEECKGKDELHEPLCHYKNARKQLYRGGIILQKIFHEFCEATFMLSMSEARVEQGKLCFTSEVARPGDSPFYTFQDLFPEFRKALITWNRGVHGVAFMNSLVAKVLSFVDNPASNLSELIHVIDPSHQKCVCYNKDVLPKINKPRGDLHTIVSVALEDGYWYVLDLSGAQYGLDEVIIPPEEYLGVYSTGVEYKADFGHTYKSDVQEVLKERLDHDLEPWFDTRALIICDKIKIKMEAEIKLFEEESGMTLPNLLNQPQDVFTATSNRLISTVKDVIWSTATAPKWLSLAKNDFLDKIRSELREQKGFEPTDEQMREELELILFEDQMRLWDHKN